MTDHAIIQARIAGSRERLANTLTELHRRIVYARTILSPRTYLGDPWLKLGAAVAAAYALGRPNRRGGLARTISLAAVLAAAIWVLRKDRRRGREARRGGDATDNNGLTVARSFWANMCPRGCRGHGW